MSGPRCARRVLALFLLLVAPAAAVERAPAGAWQCANDRDCAMWERRGESAAAFPVDCYCVSADRTRLLHRRAVADTGQWRLAGVVYGTDLDAVRRARLRLSRRTIVEMPLALRGMAAPRLDREGRFLYVPLVDGTRVLLLQRDRRSGALAYEGVRSYRSPEDRAEQLGQVSVRAGSGFE